MLCVSQGEEGGRPLGSGSQGGCQAQGGGRAGLWTRLTSNSFQVLPKEFLPLRVAMSCLCSSSSKNVTALVVACLVDRGHLEYDAPVSKYWPEFAQNGKESITLADVMRHEAGLYKLNKFITLEDIQTEEIKVLLNL